MPTTAWKSAYWPSSSLTRLNRAGASAHFRAPRERLRRSYPRPRRLSDGGLQVERGGLLSSARLQGCLRAGAARIFAHRFRQPLVELRERQRRTIGRNEFWRRLRQPGYLLGRQFVRPRIGELDECDRRLGPEYVRD